MSESSIFTDEKQEIVFFLMSCLRCTVKIKQRNQSVLWFLYFWVMFDLRFFMAVNDSLWA